MSFLSVLKKIGQVSLNVAPVAATLVGGPAAGAAVAGLINKTTDAAFKAEELHQDIKDGGGVKRESVINQVKADLELTRAILALDGKDISYDESLLGQAVDAQVAAINSQAEAVRKMIAFKDSIHPVPKQ
jgi:hypothetical protein